jgi:hypothetical protein
MRDPPGTGTEISADEKEKMREKLRIAVLLNDFVIPSWKFQIINLIKDSEFSEIVLVIKNISACSTANRKKSRFTSGLLKLIEKADRLAFRTVPDFKADKDLSGIMKGVRQLDLDNGPWSGDTALNNSVISEIRSAHPDVILKFGYHDLDGDILKIPKYGVWSHSIDSLNDQDSPDPGFWEVIRNIPVTNPRLEILTADNRKTEVIFSSMESTCRYSVNINRNGISWRSALFAPRVMSGLYRYGDDYLSSLRNRNREVRPVSQGSMVPVTVQDAVVILFRYCGIVARSIIKKLMFTDAFRWKLWYGINGGKRLDTGNFGRFKRLSSPSRIFWADPFVITEEDGYQIFVEEFIYKIDRAHISVLKLDKEGNFLGSRKIIERPYHMSYPFVFKIDNIWFMIPETCKNKTIQLYKCTEFPYKWEFDRNIMENISAVDTTLFHWNNKWWLFTAVDQTADISGCSAELFLFFSDDVLSGKWVNHPLNPIVSDIRTARPAGNLFIENGKIFRPSQNCSGRYGIGFNINQVTKLTENEYEETLVTEVKPVWERKLKGTHTINSDGDFTIIDVYSFRRRSLI